MIPLRILLLIGRYLWKRIGISDIERIRAAVEKARLEKVHVCINQPWGDVLAAYVGNICIFGDGAVDFGTHACYGIIPDNHHAVFDGLGAGAIKERSAFQDLRLGNQTAG